jgi:hypothetical protein
MLGLVFLLASVSAAGEPLVFETDTFLYEISQEAASVAFVDKASEEDYCDAANNLPFAAWIDDSAKPATAARRDGELLTLQFGGEEREARFKVTAGRRRLEFELLSLHGKTDGLRELHFARIPLTLASDPNAPFAVSPLALNLETYVAEIPGYSATLSGAKCFAQLGMKGAAMAVVACPSGELRHALKDAIDEAEGIVKSLNGGPWAYDSEINQQSYFLDVSGKVNEESINKWIVMLQALGVRQLDLHAGHAFRFGDYAPNPDVYPNRYDSLKAVVDRLHEAGILAGLHTYAMFIAKDTPWVTPVPDPGLAKNAVFTLSENLSETAPTVSVLESTEKMSALTGFHHRNSATLQIDDELIVFKGVSKEAPYAFTECERGAYGTGMAAHTKDAKVYHLKECFGLFAPDPDSELFYKVIDATAKTYNYCGFDMMYMDALDGSDVIDLKAGGQLGWYYGAKFTYELVKRLNKPPLMEMSTFGHHLWAVRSRMGAWDACQRAPQTFADIHMMSNSVWNKHFLPTNLGWWAIFDYHGVQPKRSLTDDVEYICGKALGTKSSLSFLLGFSPDTFADSTNQQRLGHIIRRYEDLRLNNAVPETVRRKLAEPGSAFTLEGDLANGWAFRPVDFARHDLALENGSDSWTVQNNCAAQTPRIRIEALLSAEKYDADESFAIEEFADLAVYGDVTTQQGVSAEFSRASGPVRGGTGGAMLTAKNNGSDPKRAWVCVERVFEKPVDLSGKGMGLWVHGDGQGAMLNIQLRNPRHVTFALTEHYIKLDFTGWRYVELLDTADYEIEDFEWPYSKPRADWEKDLASAMGFAYPMYHAHLNYAQIGELRITMNNLPEGKEVNVMIGAIRAIPHKETSFKNPVLNLSGRDIAFPLELASGNMLEFTPPRAFTVYDKTGEIFTSGELEHDAPQLKSGVTDIVFTCEPAADANAHARVTITTAGNALKE